jgi:hypothetical protein
MKCISWIKNTLVFMMVKFWECIECYLNLPEASHPDQNPLNCAHIHESQQQGKQLLTLQVNNSDN